MSDMSSSDAELFNRFLDPERDGPHPLLDKVDAASDMEAQLAKEFGSPAREPDDEKVREAVLYTLANDNFDLNYRLKRVASLLATNGYLGRGKLMPTPVLDGVDGPAKVQKKQRRLAVVKMIISDLEVDAEKIDGMDFSGACVGRVLGELTATIQALAKVIESIEEDGI